MCVNKNGAFNDFGSNYIVFVIKGAFFFFVITFIIPILYGRAHKNKKIPESAIAVGQTQYNVKS